MPSIMCLIASGQTMSNPAPTSARKNSSKSTPRYGQSHWRYLARNRLRRFGSFGASFFAASLPGVGIFPARNARCLCFDEKGFFTEYLIGVAGNPVQFGTTVHYYLDRTPNSGLQADP